MKNRYLREAHEKSPNEMEELKRFQGSTFDTISRRKLVEDRDDSRNIKEAESVRSGPCHVPTQPALFSPFRHLCGMLSCSVGMPSRNDKPPDTWDAHGISGKVFVNPTASS